MLELLDTHGVRCVNWDGGVSDGTGVWRLSLRVGYGGIK
jgi:hypothetical protein